jgi:phage gp36-like protein
MAYCTIDDVRLNLDQFEENVISDADVTSFIAKAEAYINSILANVYTLPFVVTIPLLKDVSTDLACYYVLRRNYTRDNMSTSDWVMQFWEDFNKKMEDIKDGKISLVDDSGNVIAYGSKLIQHNNENYTPTCDLGDAEDWVIDPDRLDDIADAKK